MAIRALLIDLGNVLVRFDHRHTCRRLAAPAGLDVEEVYARVFTSGLERDFDLGRVDERAFAARVIEALEAPALPPAEVLAAWAEIFTRDETNLARLAPLGEAHRLVLLSNTNATHFRECERLVPELARFDARVLSFVEGTRKPEPEIFARALQAAGVEAHEAVFVDDGAEHVEAARALGITGVLHAPGSDMAEGLAAAGVTLG